MWQSEAERQSCDIEQVAPDLAPDAFAKRFYDLSRPVLVRGALSLAARCQVRPPLQDATRTYTWTIAIPETRPHRLRHTATPETRADLEWPHLISCRRAALWTVREAPAEQCALGVTEPDAMRPNRLPVAHGAGMHAHLATRAIPTCVPTSTHAQAHHSHALTRCSAALPSRGDRRASRRILSLACVRPQRPCGTFTMAALNGHPMCSDAERTLPVCALKPHDGVNNSAPFHAMPARFRYADGVPPAAMLSNVWVRGGSRQLFAGGRGSGAALHFHNPAYNVQFFGVKRWLLTPPRYAGITGAASTRWDVETRSSSVLPAELPLRCTQGPGDSSHAAARTHDHVEARSYDQPRGEPRPVCEPRRGQCCSCPATGGTPR